MLVQLPLWVPGDPRAGTRADRLGSAGLSIFRRCDAEFSFEAGHLASCLRQRSLCTLSLLRIGFRGRRRLADQPDRTRGNDRGGVQAALGASRQGEGAMGCRVLAMCCPFDDVAAEEADAPSYEHVVRRWRPVENLSRGAGDVGGDRLRRRHAEAWTRLLPEATVGAQWECLPSIVQMTDVVILVGVAGERTGGLAVGHLVEVHPSDGSVKSFGLNLPPLVLRRRRDRFVRVADCLVLVRHDGEGTRASTTDGV